ncbi:hypothetical protein DSO57_1033969 [Entomophthora muscae]|uniref:Uncharacterized protein n=1 Tax=Entomophthora muscae TaxID=34485 RepID=A0ACC2RES4_9FUNG|nr:hypothetical protein DSO57_1033969 [Entomophthora muscae]
MTADLEGNVQLLADLKVKALRHLDSELGIFTHNFELLPNVDLLYKFRKHVLMVQPSTNSPNSNIRPRAHKRRSLSINPKNSVASPGPVGTMMGKLESLLFNFNSRDGYFRLDN